MPFEASRASSQRIMSSWPKFRFPQGLFDGVGPVARPFLRPLFNFRSCDWSGSVLFDSSLFNNCVQYFSLASKGCKGGRGGGKKRSKWKDRKCNYSVQSNVPFLAIILHVRCWLMPLNRFTGEGSDELWYQEMLNDVLRVCEEENHEEDGCGSEISVNVDHVATAAGEEGNGTQSQKSPGLILHAPPLRDFTIRGSNGTPEEDLLMW